MRCIACSLGRTSGRKTRVCPHAGAVVACPDFAASPVLLSRRVVVASHRALRKPSPTALPCAMPPKAGIQPATSRGSPQTFQYGAAWASLVGWQQTYREDKIAPLSRIACLFNSCLAHMVSVTGSLRETLHYTCAAGQLSYSRTGGRCCRCEENHHSHACADG